MSAWLNKLKIIEQESDGWFKSELREEIADLITEYRPRIDIARPLEDKARGKILLKLLQEISALKSVSSNINSDDKQIDMAYEVIELWLQSLLSDEAIDKAHVDELINSMQNRV